MIGEVHLGQRAARRPESERGVLGIQPHLDRGALRLRAEACEVEFARGLAHHPLDEIDAGDRLGHAVFHLQPRVDLEEVEVAAVGVEHVLDGTGRAPAHRLPQTHRRVEQRRARRRRQMRRRGLLDHLLVAPLHRAVALAQRDDVAAAVAEELHLDVARTLDVLLDVHAGVLEVGLRQPRDRCPRRVQLGGRAHQAHADAPAAAGALQHHRKADAFALRVRRRDIGQQSGAWQQRHALGLRQRARRVLQPERAHLRRRRSDEHETGGDAGLGERRVLGQEAVARVDRLRAGGTGGREDAVDREVAVGGRRRSDRDGLVGGAHVQRRAIGLGVHGDRRHAHATQRADHAAGDGTAVGDQDLVEHGGGTGGRAVPPVERTAPGRPAAVRGATPVRPGPTRSGAPASDSSRCTDCSAAGSSR